MNADLNIPDAPAIEGARHVHSGKVRDLYALESGPHAGHLLMVASDRISAYDFVLDTPIPDKGEILTRMSLWWFEQLRDVVANHVLSTDVPDAVRGRAVVCERLDMFPVECVVRGYLTGSGLREYDATGEVCGIALPPGWSTAAGCPSRSSRRRRRPSSATTTRTSPSRRSWPRSAPRRGAGCAA